MQRIIHKYRNASPIFMLMEELYAYVSDYSHRFDDIIWLDTSFSDLLRILQEYLFRIPDFETKEFNYPKLDYKLNSKEVVVCLSGGKDSAAVAYYYRKQGYNVHLYHMSGINKAYGDEKTAAEKIAEYLGCDLFIDKVKLEGTHLFIEHPMKNMLIANGAIHYALAMNYSPVIATGNFYKSKLADNPFEVCAGDCIEMWSAYNEIIKTIIPDFQILIPLETNADTFNILKNDANILQYSISCMSPFRFREHWKHRTEEKYNVRILPNRCGCCWKDCLEAMWLMDTDNMEFNEEYYLHCFEILKKTHKKETNEPVKDPEIIWNKYMFYPFIQSKCYEQLKTPYLERKNAIQVEINKKYRKKVKKRNAAIRAKKRKDTK